MSAGREHSYEFGPFRLDPAERRLLRMGEPVPLTPKCFDLLVVFVENSGHLLEKQELMERVWPDQFVEESNLSFSVSTLRKALGKAEGDKPYIETVKKKGFRFAAPVREVNGGLTIVHDSVVPATEQPAEAATPTPAPLPAEAGAGERRPVIGKRLSRGVVAGLLAGLALLVLVVFLLARRPAAGDTPRSIAVLPFKPLSDASRDESLEMGMTETLINKLSGLRQVVVTPIASVRKYTDPQADPSAVGRELQVDAVLDGSIQRADNRIRVTVRLINARDGTPFWSDQFDENFTDIFNVQDSISERVVRALTLRLNEDDRQRLAKRYTTSPDAYQLYLQGHYLFSKRTSESRRKSLDYYRQAVEKDPRFALAYVGIAETYILRSGFNELTPGEALSKAREAVGRAIEIDDSLAEAHNTLAELMYQWEFDWAGADEEFKRALALNPNVASIHLAHGWYLMCLARFDEAQTEMEKAQELDPRSMPANIARGRLFYYRRQYDKSIEHYRKILEVEPSANLHIPLLDAYARSGRHAEALEEFLKVFSKDDNQKEVESFREVFRASGWQGLTRKLAGMLEEQARSNYVSPYIRAAVYASAGMKDQALDMIGRSIDERDPAVARLKIEPGFDPLRADPRFPELLRRINLTP